MASCSIDYTSLVSVARKFQASVAACIAGIAIEASVASSWICSKRRAFTISDASCPAVAYCIDCYRNFVQDTAVAVPNTCCSCASVASCSTGRC